jgi:ABC-type transport system involved in cytochrome c biogenesis permease subunit
VETQLEILEKLTGQDRNVKVMFSSKKARTTLFQESAAELAALIPVLAFAAYCPFRSS